MSAMDAVVNSFVLVFGVDIAEVEKLDFRILRQVVDYVFEVVMGKPGLPTPLGFNVKKKQDEPQDQKKAVACSIPGRRRRKDN